MATKTTTVTETPTELVRGLDLNGSYTLQVIGSGTVKLAESATVPEPGDGAHILRPHERIGITTGDDGVYVWTAGGESRIAVTEAG